jgi:hypothetical protein
MAFLLTQEQAKKELLKETNGLFSLISKYEKCETKVTVKCNTCGEKFVRRYKDVKSLRSLCPFCMKKEKGHSTKPVSLEEFKRRIKLREDGDEYEYVSGWVDNKTGCKVKHLTCGYIWEPTPKYFISKVNKCPVCSNKNRGKYALKENYLEEILIKNNCEKEYEWQEEYKNNNKLKHKIKHLVCGTEYKVRPNDFQQGYRCSFCFKTQGCSKGETQVKKFIEKIYKGKIKKGFFDGYELDIYLPDLNLAFEFNGLYWHSEKFKDKDYHYNKMKIANKYNIRLIQIFEDEWNYKQNIVKSKIRYLLNKIQKEKIINARECYIKEISSTKKDKFLINNHLQGKDISNIKLGLFYKKDKKLKGVMTFSLPRLSLGRNLTDENIFELSRFCVKRNFLIRGGFQKLFAYFKNNYEFDKIITYADLRWSVGNIYASSGFQFNHYSKPNYWYTDKYKRFHRFNFRKQKLKKMFPKIYKEELTEKKIMKETKYLRIWDCGNLVYSFTK